MNRNLTAAQVKVANAILERFDTMARHIQANHEAWGLSLDDAKPIVNHLDRVADDFESQVFGQQSLVERQIEVLKLAKVIQQDSDEPYMKTFANPMKPHQTDSDEPYMQAYADDQSSAVNDGKSTTGRPLAP